MIIEFDKTKNKYLIIGLMSGTSLDGLDICYAAFSKIENFWQYELLESETYEYNNLWLSKLKKAIQLSSKELKVLDIEYGLFLGELVNLFVENKKINLNEVDLISSHGHTIFHQPEKKISIQIGHGGAIMQKINKTVICDFRTQDVILGGQGAPLVPIGDELLFHKNNACLNLGGFSNISYKKNNKIIAFDICAVNTVLNNLTKTYFSKPFDKDGELAKMGRIDLNLLNDLNNIAYYMQNPPKSLGIEWVNEQVIPILDKYKKDLLTTYTEHVAQQIAKVINENKLNNILVTGGGAKNKFLIERIEFHSNQKFELPSDQLINFKEALIFAFMGVLKIRNEINVLSSVTGACKNHSSGVIYY